MRRALAITLALFALLYVVARVRYAPPAPASADAPSDRFSATRAREVQARLVGDGATRAVGTAGNARGREVVVTELRKLGWTVELQSAPSCTYHGMCAPIVNVVARLPGTLPDIPGVLISAHYDSVPVNAGASDDGLGVAALLETARALAQGPKVRRTIVAVVTDGEEAGLLGANAFVREHPLAKNLRATVNIDARGSHGPSQMFETSIGNAWLLDLVATNVARPVTTSLFFEVYKRMPNDTDFSITKTIASGVNFANTAGIEDYHTTRDTLAASDPGTLQQHGDNMLAMTRALAGPDLGGRSTGPSDAVWFDVLALGIIRWPASWSVLLAVIGLALVAGHGLRARAFDRGLFVFVPAVVAGGIAAGAAGWVLKSIGAIPAPFVAQPLPAIAAIELAAAAAALAVMLPLARRATPRTLWSGVWLGWGTLAVVVAGIAPGASYLFTVPTLIAGVFGSIALPAACVAPAAAAATLVLALATGLYDALGFGVPLLIGVPILLLATTLAPMLADASGSKWTARSPIALAALALGAIVVARMVPKFTVSHPQRVNVVFRQDEAGARVFVDPTWGPSTWGEAPAGMLTAIGGKRELRSSLPWTLPSQSVEALRIDLEPPVAIVGSVEDEAGRHRVRLRVRSQRGASTLALVFPPGRRVEVKVAGRYATPRAIAEGSLVGLLAVPEDGVSVELDAGSAGPIPFTLLDRTFSLPPGTKAEDAARARPEAATPFQDGDGTVVTTSLSL